MFGQELLQAVTVIPLVAASFGISIVPHSFSDFDVSGATYIDIEADASTFRDSPGLSTRPAFCRYQECDEGGASCYVTA